MKKKPSFAIALRHEVRRNAAREVRRAVGRMRTMQRQIRSLTEEARRYRQSMAALERRMSRLQRQASRPFPRVGANRGRRLSGESIRSLRGQLRMSRKQFAGLVGVSPGSIFGWETGRTAPRRASLARIVELRKMGVRAARGAAQTNRRTARRSVKRTVRRRKRPARRG